MKMPMASVNRWGEPCTKMKYTRVAAVVGKRMKPQENEAATESGELVNPNEPVETDEIAVEYKGAYLLISNRYDAPIEVMGAWLKRWRIGVTYRKARTRHAQLPFTKRESYSRSHNAALHG